MDELSNAFETEASFANKKLFVQGSASFLGDYIALAAREFREISEGLHAGKWESNASASGGHEDFFVAWTDNRDVRGEISSIDESISYSYTPEITARLLDELTTDDPEGQQLYAGNRPMPDTGPLRDGTRTAEGLDGGDPNAIAACQPETERTRDSNIYGSLIKDQLRLYAPTPAKPLSGLQRAFVVAISNSAIVPKTYQLNIIPGNCLASSGNCLASFRQNPSSPPFVADPDDLTETVTVSAKSTLARTVFVSGYQAPVKIEAFEGSQLVATITLANSPQMLDPENCADSSCSVAFNELHNIELQTVTASLLNKLMNADLLNASLLNAPLLVQWAKAGGCCDDEDPATVGSVIEYAVENLAEADIIDQNVENAALLNAALLNANLLNANLLNANLLNAALLNANLLNANPEDVEKVFGAALLDETAGCCGNNPTIGDIIVYAIESLNTDDLINVALLNAALLNINLLNANLLNANLLNANLLNANLLNADLLNAALLNASLLNPEIEAANLLNADLLNANLLNADLLNANLLNPTLVALATEGGCCDDEDTPTVGSILIYAVGHPETINAALLNAALLNAALLNANLLNANLLNANLLNANLLNADLLNANLLNADLLNADLLNANLLNTHLLDEAGNAMITYDDYTFPITNNGNVTTAVGADISINAPMVIAGNEKVLDIIGAKLMTWTVNATPTVINCVDRVQLNTRVHSIVAIDSTLDIATIVEPFNGATSTIVAPGETFFVTLRVFGTADQLKNVRVIGFTASSQAANCVTVNGQPVCDTQLNEGIEQILFADTTPPVITVPADFSIEATSTLGAVVTYPVTVFDANDANPSLVCSPESGELFDHGTTTVRCDAWDFTGNDSTVTFNVNVVDTTEPVITLTGDSPVTVEAGATYSDAGATASDISDGDLTSVIVTVNLVNTLNVRSYTVTYNVVDASGNAAAEESRGVTVQDTTIPAISLLGANPQLVEAGDIYTELKATASDPVFGDISGLIIIDASNVDTSTVGNYTVTYNVVDASDNAAAEVTRTVNVVDTIAPVINTPPSPLVISSDSSPVAVNFTVSVTDAGHPATAATCMPASGSNFPWGDTPVTCDASDGSGNHADSASFTVTLRYIYNTSVTTPKRVAKVGSTIPLDWQYLDWDSGLPVDSSALAPDIGITWASTDYCVNANPTGIRGEDSGSSNFRYSFAEMLWQYSLQTKNENLVEGKYLIIVLPPGEGVPEASVCVNLK